MTKEKTVHVVVKMYQGVIDDVDVFTDPKEAEAELENWKAQYISKEDEEEYGLEGSDIEGSQIFETTLIERKLSKPIIYHCNLCDTDFDTTTGKGKMHMANHGYNLKYAIEKGLAKRK